jgi:hypothetical protein
MKQTYKKIQGLYTKYERFLIPGMLLLGFVADLVTFKALNIRTAFILLGVHATIVGGGIVFLHAYDEGKYRRNQKKPILHLLRIAVPLALQFSMGALLSAVMIFYLFSGAFAVSWPFFIIVIFLMLSNELYREYYLRPVVQLGVYYFIWFTLGALVLAFVFQSINPLVFISAGGIAMVGMFGLYRLLVWLVPAIIEEQRQIRNTVVSIFVVLLGLYFFNLIPPAPLSVRDAGVYHHIERIGGMYLAEEQERHIIHSLLPGHRINVVEGDPLYVFSAIYAPLDLSTEIIHEWQYFDPHTDRWVSKDALSYAIFGGRNDGYRGYTRKTSLNEGRWRVDIKTNRGQVIGRYRFRVQFVDTPVPTKSIMK